MSPPPKLLRPATGGPPPTLCRTQAPPKALHAAPYRPVAARRGMDQQRRGTAVAEGYAHPPECPTKAGRAGGEETHA